MSKEFSIFLRTVKFRAQGYKTDFYNFITNTACQKYTFGSLLF